MALCEEVLGDLVGNQLRLRFLAGDFSEGEVSKDLGELD